MIKKETKIGNISKKLAVLLLVFVVVGGLAIASDIIAKLGSTPSFEVEGNMTVDTNTLIVDSTNNRVGIGTTVPTQSLEIGGSGRIAMPATTYGMVATTYSGTGYGFSSQNPLISLQSPRYFAIAQIGQTPFFTAVYDEKIGIGTATPQQELNVVGDVNVTGDMVGFSTTPAFLVCKDGTDQAITTGTITNVTWQTEKLDANSDFDIANNMFVAPVTGNYHFDAQARLNTLNSAKTLYILLYVNSVRYAERTIYTANQHSPVISLSILVPLSAGDEVTIKVYHDHGANRDIEGTELGNADAPTWFSGHLVPDKVEGN